MNDNELLKRIEINPKVMVGKPIIRGTRLTVEFILDLLAHGSTIQGILNEYKGITEQDIQACNNLDMLTKRGVSWTRINY